MKKPLFKIGVKDAIKGIIVSVFSTILSGVVVGINSGAIPSTAHDFKPILLSGAAAGIGYITKNLLENEKGEFLKK